MPGGVYIRTKEHNIKIGLGQLGRKPTFGMLGKKHTEESKKKMSKALKGRIISEETRKKTSETMKRKGLIPPNTKGRKHTEESLQKMRNKRASEETKRKISEANTGRIASDETRQKQRESRFAYIRKTVGFCYPNIGKNETKILDDLEKELGYRIIRQYQVGGYHLDGYIPEINLAIEIDERHHKKQTDKDIKREEFIKAKLGCSFMRIKDYV